MEGPGPRRGGFSTPQSATGTNCVCILEKSEIDAFGGQSTRGALRLSVRGPIPTANSGRSVARRVTRMTVHTSNGGGGGNGADGSGPGAEKLSKDELKKYRLKKAMTYIDDEERPLSQAAKSKRKQREKREGKNIVQCGVEVPKEGRPAIQALAATMRADHNLHEVIASVASSDDLRKLIRSLLASGYDVASISELIQREELLAILTACSTNSTLLESASLLANSNDDISSALADVIRAVVDDRRDTPATLQVMAACLQHPDAVLSMTKVRRAGGMRARILMWVLGRS